MHENLFAKAAIVLCMTTNNKVTTKKNTIRKLPGLEQRYQMYICPFIAQSIARLMDTKLMYTSFVFS